MRTIGLLIGVVLCVLCNSVCFAEQVYWGIEYWQENVKGSNNALNNGEPNKLYILKVDLQAKGIRPFVTPELNRKVITTSQFVETYKVQVGINTAFFDIGNTNRAIGFFVSNGIPYKDNIPNDAMPTLGFSKDNRYYQGAANRSKMYNACSGSNDLVVNGEAIVYNDNVEVHPRTVAGIDKSGRYFFMIVVDGRYSQSKGMTLTAIGKHMVRLGIYNGINLDGGGSSTMVIQGKGLVNRPVGGTYQRPVASHLGFFANKTCSPSEEVCNRYDDDCDGLVDENGVCPAAEDPLVQSMIYDPQNTDIDGDGIADICARSASGIQCAFSKSGNLTTIKNVLDLSDASGWNDSTNYGTIRFADYNGDGRADLCARDNSGVKCWMFNGEKFDQSSETIPMSDADGYNDAKYYSTIRFADINGDGRDDMCARFKDGFRCYPAVDNGWGTAIALGDMSDALGWDKPQYYSTIRMGDINGDGKADVCARAMKRFQCWLSEGDKYAPFFSPAEWSDQKKWNQPEYYETIRLADINGDHKADLCARDSEGLVCYLSQGTSMGEAIRGPALSDKNGWNDYDNYSTFRFGDINGDGMDDFCARANAKFSCYLATGTGFGENVSIADMSDDKGWNQNSQHRTIRLGDVNGDGKMDICGRSSSGVQCYSYNGSGFDVISGPAFSNQSGWDKIEYYSTLRIGGPFVKSCSHQKEICDQIDNNCNGEIDENNVCCEPSEEICDGEDNDCDGEVDEDGVCCVTEVCDGKDNDCDGEVDEDDVCCEPSEEICDGEDNDCDGMVDEDDVCCVTEVCDGEDNDCDGMVDEDDVCNQVFEECTPSDEICDGKDNDCDGEVDEDDVCHSGDNDNPPIHEQDTGQSRVDEDCGCSVKGSGSAPNPLIALFLLGGLGWWHRRRRI